MRLALITTLALFAGCKQPETKDGRDKTTETGTSTTTPAPEWARTKPSIDGGDLIPGHTHHLEVSGLPDGARVLWLQTTTGVSPGGGACLDEYESVCTDLLEHEVLLEEVAGTDGVVAFSADVPSEASPTVVYFQAWVHDPASDASALSSVLQRHIAVPARDRGAHPWSRWTRSRASATCAPAATATPAGRPGSTSTTTSSPISSSPTAPSCRTGCT